MPELPEVQTTVDGLNRTVKGLVIKDVWTNYNSKHYVGKKEIKDPTYFKEFKSKTIGAKIIKTERRAKNILMHLSTKDTVLIHMKMTGHIMYGSYVFNKEKEYINDPWKAIDEGPLKDPFNRHIRLVFTFTNNKQLVLSDMRKFAKVTLIHTKDIEKSHHIEKIGPEPLDVNFTFSLFKDRLSIKSTGKIKTVLMDQHVIAGVGNIYSDEALWRSSVHPETQVKSIPEKSLKKIYISVKEVLLQGIDFGGDSMSDYRNIYGEQGNFQLKHQAYRKTGQKCTKKGCSGTIHRKVIGGRSAHFCNEHQKTQS